MKFKNNFGANQSYKYPYILYLIFLFQAFRILIPPLSEILVDKGFFSIALIDLLTIKNSAFIINFFEGISLIYAFSVPLIMGKVAENFETIKSEIEKESETTKLLFEHNNLLKAGYAEQKKNITRFLRDYTKHVFNEFGSESINDAQILETGNKILGDIRNEFDKLIHPSKEKTKESDILVSILFQNLSDLTIIRKNRIFLLQNKTVTYLQTVTFVSSLSFVIPLFSGGITKASGTLDYLVVLSIVALVTFLYFVIEDMNNPFTGFWNINTESWERLLETIESHVQS